MYLKRITIAGFKSFGGRSVLDLETGITAVVGPNGSGKSNLADAIRWALGEQSKSRLRLGDREEVVFAGTEKKARASFAEVVLTFNNDDGAFPIEMTEVEISRRLYRSGETDYRLAGRSVRLADIQQLLAEAGFGANTYAVIGQGMIDSFLLSSPAERKLLFDEAAGIRGPELKREAAMRKLAATEANLVRLRDIAGELEPRLASLKRSVAAAEAQRGLEGRLADARQRLLDAAAGQLEERTVELVAQRDELTLQLRRLQHEAAGLEHDQTARLAAAQQLQAERAEHTAQLRGAEAEYDARLAELAQLRTLVAQFDHDDDRQDELIRAERRLTTEVEKGHGRLADVKDELKANAAAAARAARAIDRTSGEVAKAQAELVAIRQAAADGTQQQYVSHALSIVKTMAQDLSRQQPSLDQLRLMVHKTGRLLSHASKTGEAELVQKIRAAQAQLEAAMTRRETATEHQTNITITARSLEMDQTHQQVALARLESELEAVRREASELAARRDDRAAHVRQLADGEQAVAALKTRLDELRALAAADPAELDSATIAEAATRLERLRSQTATTTAQLADIETAAAAIRAEQARYAAQATSWGIQPVAAAGPADLAELERKVMRLEGEVAARHSLQDGAVAEYEEVSQRAAELATQIADLEQAQGDLRQVVARLDDLIRQRFRDNFATLAERFSTYFHRLFEGGSASLQLEEADDGSYGILIKASPKGKRLTNLAVLSGGERALAGVALLAAILSVNPSPFVVLDEIDAALDEANSGRLAGILEELAGRSQLIVITHNRQTMTAAKVLFGVTMNEHHVSHLLSLRLEEARALAAR